MNSKNDDFIRNMTKESIRRALPEMTPVEKNAAAFFLENMKQQDYASRTISRKLFLSEATLSRFAKKCGYRGYREFIYSYEKDLDAELATAGQKYEQNLSVISRRVEASYQQLLTESMRQIQVEELQRVAGLLNTARRVKGVGQGSSGFAAREFQLRFMRIGLEVEAITDSQVISMSAAILSPCPAMRSRLTLKEYCPRAMLRSSSPATCTFSPFAAPSPRPSAVRKPASHPSRRKANSTQEICASLSFSVK